MNKCLSCKYSYFRKDGKVDRLICNCNSTPDKDSCICDRYIEDVEFMGTLSLNDKSEPKQ